MHYFLSALMGYLMGSVNPSYFLARIHGVDIREKGSKNAGASNALILFGKVRGVLCALFDIAKAAFIIWLTSVIFSDTNTFAITAAACILGHIFPFYIRFRGGKGLACLGGCILAYNPLMFLIMLAGEIVFVLIVKYICFVPMTASVAFAILYGVMSRDLYGALLLGVVAIVVICKHIVNIKRIIQGKEARISYLWSKDKETARLKEKYGEEE